MIGLQVCAPHGGDNAPVSVEVLRGRLPGIEVRQQTAELFRLLADPTRVSILHALLEAGELCVCDLAAVVEVPENVVSQALRLLRVADIVRTRRDGRRIHYRLADAHVRMLLDLSADHLLHLDEVPGAAKLADSGEALPTQSGRVARAGPSKPATRRGVAGHGR